VFFPAKTISDFHCKIAITIAIENYSGKNGIRFSFLDRAVNFLEKRSVNFMNIGSWLNSLLAGVVAYEQTPHDTFSQVIEKFCPGGNLRIGSPMADPEACDQDAADLCPVQIINITNNSRDRSAPQIGVITSRQWKQE